jgi:hypothetical protein
MRALAFVLLTTCTAAVLGQKPSVDSELISQAQLLANMNERIAALAPAIKLARQKALILDTALSMPSIRGCQKANWPDTPLCDAQARIIMKYEQEAMWTIQPKTSAPPEPQKRTPEDY